MAKRVFAFGFEMAEKQLKELREILTLDILERYDNGEYWSRDAIEAFATDNGLSRIEK